MNLVAHLPILPVVVPLISAPIAVLSRRGSVAFVLATTASWAALALAVALWVQVGAEGTISYAIGNWPPPWGIEYRIDTLSAFVLVLVSGVAAIILPYCRRSIEAELPREQHYLFYAMFGLCLAGLLGIVATGDAFNIFVFVEISALASYALIALGRDRRALVASYQYLIMGTIGATFLVIGIGLLYLMTGTLNLADMRQRLADVSDMRPVLTALAFITAGMSLKLALFPLHQWLPNAYSHAPSAVSAFLAGTATKVSVYVLLRFYYSVFGAGLVSDLGLREVLLVLSLAAMFAASALAIFQTDLKKLLAYSSVAQIGYITLGLSFESVAGLTASIVHLFNHGITKAGLFMLVGGAVLVMGGSDMSRLAGLGRAMPLTSFGVVLGGLSLIGVPGTAGFISKWSLIVAALERNQWWLVFAIALSSLLALAYVWRFVEAAYLREPAQPREGGREAPPSMLISAWILVAASIYFGLDSSLTLGSAMAGAQSLLGAAP
ncbi:MAG: monovalent cation/H+ antiporter subunit D family protein [Burkholderiales bacterium]|nr:monovalent cation/H+ antiporter subunit D family protein [Burkholderiales bacterium]